MQNTGGEIDAPACAETGNWVTQDSPTYVGTDRHRDKMQTGIRGDNLNLRALLSLIHLVAGYQTSASSHLRQIKSSGGEILPPI